MLFLLIGLTIFYTIHMVPWTPALRDKLINSMGPNGYKILFSVISAVGLGLAILGYAVTDGPVMWPTPVFGTRVAFLLIPFAFILVVGAYVGSNIKRVTPHPMAWGVALWAFAHLMNNGEIESVILFGTLLVFALGSIVSANKRGATVMVEKAPIWRDIVTGVGGMAAAMIVAMNHAALFGVSIIPAGAQ